MKFWILLAVSFVLLLLLSKFDTQGTTSHSERKYDRMGRPVAFSNGFPFKDQQAEILKYGLQDVRGLACDESGKHVFLSEANRSVLVYRTDTGSIRELDHGEVCPQEPCGSSDRRGLAATATTLYMAEHGRGQISERNDLAALESSGEQYERNKLLKTGLPLPGKPEIITGPSGVAAFGNTLFITDDRPWPGPGTAAGPFDSADYARWLDKGASRPFGGIFVCSSDHCEPHLVDGSLLHPSGVAAASAEGPVFVTEADSHEVRWPIYKKDPERGWIRAGALGSVAVSLNAIPVFLGIALDDSKQTVFAAGPGGLYVFSSDGESLGRLAFDEPVTGVACHRNRVYLVVGHTLCRLTVPRRRRAA